MIEQHTDEHEATPADEEVSGPPADEGHDTTVEEAGPGDPETFPASTSSSSARSPPSTASGPPTATPWPSAFTSSS